MKLERLTIHNLASIADATIDFSSDALRDEPVFLITGPTGAGKTTILDAICLALYNKTPRMERVEGKSERYTVDGDCQLSISDNRQLMRRNTGECFAELIFEANGFRYRAHWYVKRSFKRPTGNLQSIEHTLQNLTTGEIVKRGADREVEAITGLKYEQFCRTSILAQGEFTKFLQSNSNDKSDILEKLTGTGIYSRIGQKIYELTQGKKAVLELAKAQLDTVKTMTAEERLNINNAITTLNAQLSALNTKELVQLTAKRDRLKTACMWLSELQKLQAELKQASGLQQQYKDRLISLLEAASSLEAGQSQQEQQRDELKELLKAELLPSSEGDWGGVAARIADLPVRIRQANDLKVSVNRAISACQLLDERRKQMAQTSRQLHEYEERQKPLSDTLTILSKQCEDAGQEAERWQQAYSKASLSVNDWAKEMRRRLDIGDACPVCGKTVSEHLDDKHFTSVLAPIEQQKRESTLRHQQVSQQLAARQQEYKEVSRQVARLREQLGRETEAAELQRQAVETACNAIMGNATEHCDINPQRLEELPTILQRMAREAEQAATHLFELGQKASRLAMIEQQVKNLAVLLDQIRKSQQNVFEIVPAWSDIKASVGVPFSSAEGRNLDRAANDAVSRWSQLSIDITKWHAHILALRKQITERQQQLEQFWQQGDTDSQNLQETLSALERSIGEKRKFQQELQRQLGALQQQLQADDQHRQQYELLLQRRDEADKEHNRWNSFCTLFGDKEGKRFRGIAQSFILGHLLNIANRYLRHFSDRYTLTYNPGSLVILVSDSYHASPPQSASILSGGESFMVSLSLALALSNLGGRQSSILNAQSSIFNDVDTLFIDEGFGSLDSDCLGSVMDTLERLHQMGGRRVGIISHVEALQERISTKIIVSRNGSSPSKVICQSTNIT